MEGQHPCQHQGRSHYEETSGAQPISLLAIGPTNNQQQLPKMMVTDDDDDGGLYQYQQRWQWWWSQNHNDGRLEHSQVSLMSIIKIKTDDDHCHQWQGWMAMLMMTRMEDIKDCWWQCFGDKLGDTIHGAIPLNFLYLIYSSHNSCTRHHIFPSDQRHNMLIATSVGSLWLCLWSPTWLGKLESTVDNCKITPNNVTNGLKNTK